MSRLILKFGGTSVADVERIERAAAIIKSEVDAGNEVAVVVSAMGKTTDELVALADTLLPGQIDDGEYDIVVAAGEQISAGLVARALKNIGVPARSWLSWQLPINGVGSPARARIESIETDEITKGFGRGEVAIVPGYQVLLEDGRLSTMGRGGSDTSAVALAGALNADRCDIYTDVEGVFTADPRLVAKARKLDRITYEEMLEMASQGAKVLQTRSVALAMKLGVPLHVRSSFTGAPGTLVSEEENGLEDELVSGIAYSRDEAKITLVQVADRPGVAAGIFGPLADADVNVDMIVQNVSEDGKFTDLTFTVGQEDVDRAVKVVETALNDVKYERVESDPSVAKISVIGVGMRSHAGVAHRMFQALADKAINIQIISTSEIKVSVLIAEEYTELALRTLHTTYGLDDV
jgi:aspartate kinase